MILNSTDGENYKAYIAAYMLSPEEWAKVSNGEMINDKLPSLVTEFSQFARDGVLGDGADCIDIYTVSQLYCNDSGGRIIKDNGDLGSGCVGMSWPVETMVFKIAGDCMSGGNLYGPDTPSNPGNPTNPNPGGGGGSGSPNNPINNPGTNNPSPPIITTPILLYAIMPFVNSLSPEQKEWWENPENAEEKQDIVSYLQQNKTEEAQEFAEELIDVCKKLDINAAEVWNDQYDSFRNQMSDSEREIFDGLTANKKMWYMVSAKKALDKSAELFPTTFIPSNLHNGKGDAFRHALWNAYCTMFFGASLAEQLTTAHEQQTSNTNVPFQDKEIEMDLFNNEKGRVIADFSNFDNVIQNCAALF